jgi:hypothetical protein
MDVAKEAPRQTSRAVLHDILMREVRAARNDSAAVTDAEVQEALDETRNPEFTDHEWYKEAAKRLGLDVH